MSTGTSLIVTISILSSFTIFGLVFWNMIFKPMMLRKRLARTGIAATARILALGDTGVTVNNSPQVKLLLEVQPANGQPYQVEIKQIVSRLNIHLYQAGNVVPVLIDPADKMVVILNLGGTNPQTAGSSSESQIVSTGPWTGISEQEVEDRLYSINTQNNELLGYGTSARAIVRKYTWLGIYVNGSNQAAELEVEVLPEDIPAFTAIVCGVIGEQSVPKFQAGEEIYVKYDPRDTSKVTIERS